MAPYFDHMHQKSTHERRAHAMRVAGALTALVFAGWVTSISLSAGGAATQVAAGGASVAQTAAALTAAANLGNQLVVATSTQ